MPDPGTCVPASFDCGDNVDVADTADPGLVADACAGMVDGGGGRDTCRSWLARCPPPLAKCFIDGTRALCAAVEGQGGGNRGLANAPVGDIDDGSDARASLLVIVIVVGDSESFMSTSFSVLLLGGVPCLAEGDCRGGVLLLLLLVVVVVVVSYRTQSA